MSPQPFGTKQPERSNQSTYTVNKCVFFSGSDRIRRPHAANRALQTAGATGGTPSSPTPPRRDALVARIWVSTAGISARRTTRYWLKLPSLTRPALMVTSPKSAALKPKAIALPARFMSPDPALWGNHPARDLSGRRLAPAQKERRCICPAHAHSRSFVRLPTRQSLPACA
jgi:hypothetical protein